VLTDTSGCLTPQEEHALLSLIHSSLKKQFQMEDTLTMQMGKLRQMSKKHFSKPTQPPGNKANSGKNSKYCPSDISSDIILEVYLFAPHFLRPFLFLVPA
jgi:hypothetical protein